MCVAGWGGGCVGVESEGGAEVTQHICSPVKNRWPPPVRRRRHKIKERKWEEEESKFRGRISRWSISRRLIIQSGRAGGTFSWRLLPLVAAEHLYRIVCRSLVIFKVGKLKRSVLPQTSWWAELVWKTTSGYKGQ